jgi:hypothetical protein
MGFELHKYIIVKHDIFDIIRDLATITRKENQKDIEKNLV